MRLQSFDLGTLYGENIFKQPKKTLNAKLLVKKQNEMQNVTKIEDKYYNDRRGPTDK